jgi:putative molybdopterin biosynthesis protein
VPRRQAVARFRPVGGSLVHTCKAQRGKLGGEIHCGEADERNRILIAGCDPGISLLARHTQGAGVELELELAHRNGSQPLQLLKDECVHIAGAHLRDEESGESNLPAIARMFPKGSVAVISFALWEEGIVTATGNPKSIRSNRRFGAPRSYPDRLKTLGIDAKRVHKYARTAPGASPWRGRRAAARPIAASPPAWQRIYGLGFIPLASERYGLAIRPRRLDLPGCRRCSIH